MKPSLTDLAIRFGSDKLTAHTYIGTYSRLLSGMTVKRVLDIGLGYRDMMIPFSENWVEGSSLKMWAEYLPEAEIYGCDIRADVLFQADRIHTMQCDQSSLESLQALTAAFGTDFQLVSDDGSHDPHDQVFTAQYLMPLLPEGSVYVIEDCREPLHVATKLFNYRPSIRKFTKRPDDCLVIMKKVS